MTRIVQIIPYVLVTAALALAVRRSRRCGSPGRGTTLRAGATSAQPLRKLILNGCRGVTLLLGDTGLVAAREVRERIRGRMFRAGTALILAAVAAAIVIPVLHPGARAAGACPPLVTSRQMGAANGAAQTASRVGLILVFVMLTQYNT